MRLSEFREANSDRALQKRPPKPCQWCGTPFKPKKPGTYSHAKYCSRECAAHGRQAAKTVTRNCEWCGKEILVPTSRIRTHPGAGRYCSQQCRLDGWAADSLAKGAPGNYQANGWRVYDRVCIVCGYDRYPQLVVLHHKDGNRQNGAIKNLEPLCPTCHGERHIAMMGDKPNGHVGSSWRRPAADGSRPLGTAMRWRERQNSPPVLPGASLLEGES
jgi:5-methylcytosine-specific restriction endonuclease McrA